MQTDSGDLVPIDMQDKEQRELAEKNPELVFRVGETVKVKGGDFRILSFGRRALVLEGLPGTRIKR